MREIKFKGWNVATKTMVDLKKLTPFILNMDTDGLFIPFSDGLYLIQYTGLKDKNGKEIYEGDVVKKENGELYQIQYKEFGFQTIDKMDQNWYLTDWYKCEIIGNIYENPKLGAK